MIERRYDIDWLRSLGMGAVFLFHCARFFDDSGWHVKNAQVDFSVTIFVNVLAQWIMPIFFILSGISTYYGVREKERIGPYLWQRFKRLMIPLFFGIFAMIPLQVYYERVSHSQFTGTILAFYPHYFDGFYAFGGNFAWMGLHLWYLLFLFIFTVLVLPLFILLKRPVGKRLIVRMADILVKPGAVFLPGIYIAAIDFVLMPNTLIGIRDMGGWNLLTYLLLYIYGYIIAGDIRFKDAIQTQRRVTLGLGIVTLAILYYWLVHIGRPDTGFNLNYLIFTGVRCLNSWFLLIALLGYGSEYCNFNNRLLKYVSQLVLPFYILHQTVIVTIGFYVVQWNAGIAFKYFVISTSSLTIIILIYEILIKRFSILRFLFGMNINSTNRIIRKGIAN